MKKLGFIAGLLFFLIQEMSFTVNMSYGYYNLYYLKKPKRRDIFNNSFYVHSGITMISGNSRDVLSNGLLYILGYKKRYNKNITYYFEGGFSRQNLYNNLGLYQDYVDLSGVMDVNFNEFIVSGGYNFYLPIKKRLSLKIGAGIVLRDILYNISVAPDEDYSSRSDIFKKDYKSLAKNNNFLYPGVFPGVEFEAGLEFLKFYRVSIFFGYKGSFLIGNNKLFLFSDIRFGLVYYFKNFRIYEDLFRTR